MSLKKGFLAEDIAKDYLRQQGLIWLESNYRCRMGEIDLIMRDKDMLVLIEVRARKSNVFGSALESVTYTKQKKLIRTALLYVQQQRYQGPMRFDVIGLEGVPARIEWIKNAFGVNA